MSESEKQFLRYLQSLLQQITGHYYTAINQVTLVVNLVRLGDQVFELKNFPLLQQAVDNALAQLNTNIFASLLNGITGAWDLSNQKNDQMVTARLDGKTSTAKARGLLYDPNRAALEAFKARRKAGLNLSERVWRRTKTFRYELEKGLAVGISEGRSAAEMARDLRQYLNEPDRLYRRVRDSKGKFKLSQAAQNYNPGQGVYRSSYKNALRLTASETNIAYRTQDFNRWQQIPFVKGIEVHTSNNHPQHDICDHLVGLYPKDFKFTGWHVRCICWAAAVQLSDEEYSLYEDYVLGLTDRPPEFVQIETIPARAVQWISDNADTINNAKSKPFWVSDNQRFVKELLK